MKNRHKHAGHMKKKPTLSDPMRSRLREGLFLFYAAAAIFLFISLVSYSPLDPAWSSMSSHKIENWGGWIGAWLADILLFFFGAIAYLLPLYMFYSAWLLGQNKVGEKKHPQEIVLKNAGWFLMLASTCGLLSFHSQQGGVLGISFNRLLTGFLSTSGAHLFLLTAILTGITIGTGFSWVKLMLVVTRMINKIIKNRVSYLSSYQQKSLKKPLILENQKKVIEKIAPSLPTSVAIPIPQIKHNHLDVIKEKKKIDKISIQLKPGTLPAFDLLTPPVLTREKPFSELSFEALSELVEQRLGDFGVNVRVAAVHPGPIITRFELELAPGIKVSKIAGLAKDIARSLSVISVRIVEVIPGKSVIGLEIPNENREVVVLREIVESERYAHARSPLTLVLGKDTAGNPMVVDLTKMPHLLVAGTTGSGKSVSLNVMLLSMLFKATPEQLRLIMIDPKMLELSLYDGIPHLLTPVITDMKDAANALRWCVAEMDKRYRLMASLGVRHIGGYNQKVQEAIQQGHPISLPSYMVVDEESAKAYLQPLPFIVVIVDEFADMMMVVGKKVEDLIARLAQKARASGIHLILATQRPSVDVITGLIKANIPTRIAFQVSSRIDSRTILDQQGAEQLLGHGDMLYMPPGAGVPIRVHGAFVADEEVHSVVAAWRSTGEPQYLQDVTYEDAGTEGEGEMRGERDPLYDEAVRVVTESRKASISLVQRRLRVGYNRAARMIEEMETAGVVSKMDTNGTREVLVGENI